MGGKMIKRTAQRGLSMFGFLFVAALVPWR